ncbi:MAG: hypothetical protein Q8908_15510 [Bacteroidota bacterium]|nr:hypothetical protein [Bacteroidota bacterium]
MRLLDRVWDKGLILPVFDLEKHIVSLTAASKTGILSGDYSPFILL